MGAYFVRRDEVHQAVDVGAFAQFADDVGQRRGQFFLLVRPQVLFQFRKREMKETSTSLGPVRRARETHVKGGSLFEEMVRFQVELSDDVNQIGQMETQTRLQIKTTSIELNVYNKYGGNLVLSNDVGVPLR